MRTAFATVTLCVLMLCAAPLGRGQAPALGPPAFSPATAVEEPGGLANLRSQARRQYAEGNQEGLAATVAAIRALDPTSRDAMLYDSLLRRGPRPSPTALADRAATTTATAVASGTPPSEAPSATTPAPAPAGVPAASPAPKPATPGAAPSGRRQWLTGTSALAIAGFVGLWAAVVLGRQFLRRRPVPSAAEAARSLGRRAGQESAASLPSDPNLKIVNLMTAFGEPEDRSGGVAGGPERPLGESRPAMPRYEVTPQPPPEPLFAEEQAEPPSDIGPLTLDASAPPPAADPAPVFELDALPQPAAPASPAEPSTPPPPPTPAPAAAPVNGEPLGAARPATRPFRAAAQAQAQTPERHVLSVPIKARVRSKASHAVDSDDETRAPFLLGSDDGGTLFHSDDDTLGLSPPADATRGRSRVDSDDDTKTGSRRRAAQDSRFASDEDTEELPPPKEDRQ